MKKFAILAGLMALALVIGVAGTSFRTGTAQARPSTIITFNADVCASLIGQHVPTDGAKCFALNNPANLADVADDLGGSVTSADTYNDLVDASAAQLGEDSTSPNAGPNSQSMWVLVFSSNGNNVTLDADEGIWLSGAGAGTSTTTDAPNADNMTVNALYAGGTGPLDRGDNQVTATQSDVDLTLDYTVVGSPDDFSLEALPKETLQSASTVFISPDDDLCMLPTYSDTAGFTKIVGLPDVTGLLGTVVDDDGTKLTGIWVGWMTSDTDVATLSERIDDEVMEHTATIASGTVVAAPNLACGQDAGDVTIHAGVIASPSLEVTADNLTIDDEVDLTVVGGPDTLTVAQPAQITCNGVNSADVSATVLNSDGKPVPAGNLVRFDVVALGTASPIVAVTDVNGVAKTTVTPLSGVTAGVTVIATVLDQSLVQNDDLKVTRSDTASTDIEANTLVACAPAVPIVVPPVGPTGGNVTPPNTGDGGYLP